MVRNHGESVHERNSKLKKAVTPDPKKKNYKKIMKEVDENVNAKLRGSIRKGSAREADSLNYRIKAIEEKSKDPGVNVNTRNAMIREQTKNMFEYEKKSKS